MRKESANYKCNFLHSDTVSVLIAPTLQRFRAQDNAWTMKKRQKDGYNHRVRCEEKTKRECSSVSRNRLLCWKSLHELVSWQTRYVPSTPSQLSWASASRGGKILVYDFWTLWTLLILNSSNVELFEFWTLWILNSFNFELFQFWILSWGYWTP